MRYLLRDLGVALLYATLGMLISVGVASVAVMVRHPLVRYAVDQAVTGDAEALVKLRR